MVLSMVAVMSRRRQWHPLQHSCLENPMDGGAWWAAVHGVAKSRIQLSDFTFTFHFHALEKEMATHSSVLAWRIPRTGEPGGLPSLGSHRVGHDWSDLAAAAAAAAAHGNIYIWNTYIFMFSPSSFLVPNRNDQLYFLQCLYSSSSPYFGKCYHKLPSCLSLKSECLYWDLLKSSLHPVPSIFP